MSAYRIEDLRPAEHAFRLFDFLASDEKAPVITVIEEKEHLFFRLENVS